MEISLTMNELIRLSPAERARLCESPPPRKSRRETMQNAPKPLDEFFTQCYPRFNFSTTASPEAEWRRLARDQCWSPNSAEYKAARDLFETAYDDQFHSAITGFFNDYPDFEHNPHAEAKSEFERLRKHKGWCELSQNERNPFELKRLIKEYACARGKFFDAFMDDFEGFFGEGNDVRDWEYLCDVLGVKPIPESIDHCKDALKDHYVNIYDLYHHVQDKGKLLRHPDVGTLSQYSRDNNLLYPLGKAKTTCMKFLLRHFVTVPGRRWDDWKCKLVTDSEWVRSRWDPSHPAYYARIAKEESRARSLAMSHGWMEF